MSDFSWLSREAGAIHQVFADMFFPLIGVMLAVSIIVEYWRLPLGGMPGFGEVVGRSLAATLLLHAYPEICDAIAAVTNSLAEELGNLNQLQHVVSRLGEKLDNLTASWISVKGSIILALGFLSYILLYFSLYIAEGAYVFAWVLCYIFSPVLIAMFILPATAGITKSLFRTVFEVSCWKVLWSVLATLLWSNALGQINDPETGVNIIAVICFNLILAGSLLLTPLVVHSFATAGIEGVSRTAGSVASGYVLLSPTRVLSRASKRLRRPRIKQ